MQRVVARPRRVVASLVTLALLVTACGGSSSPTDLDADTRDPIEMATERWLERYREDAASFVALSPDTPPFVEELARLAHEAAADAGGMLEDGATAGAHSEAVRAAALMSGVAAVNEGFEALSAGGTDAFEAEVSAHDTAGEEVGAFVEPLRTFEPANVSQADSLMSAYGTALDAVSFSLVGVELLERPGRDERETIWLLSLSAAYFAAAPVLGEAAAEQLSFGDGLDGPPITGDPRAMGLAFQSAANAALDRFENDVILATAEDQGITDGEVKDRLSGFELDYSLSVAGLHLMDLLDEVFRDAPSESWAVLGGALTAYERTQALNARYARYRPLSDDGSLPIVRWEDPPAVEAAVPRADARLAAMLDDLRMAEVTPVGVIADYEAGIVEWRTHGDVDDDTGSPDPTVGFEQLAYLWAGAIEAAVLFSLGGIEGPVTGDGS